MEDRMPKISVIMPVYNTKEEYLRDAIESILNQTYKNFEFIIINDGSTNNAEEVILSYKDTRIKYYKQKNQGLSETLNKGFDLAKGEYIARMDSDDISLPERLEKQVCFMDNSPNIGICGSWAKFFPSEKGTIIKHPREPKYIDFILGCRIVHPTVMLRKELFDYYNLRYNKEYDCAEDYELWSRAVRFVKFYNIPEILLNYRWHENNVSVASRKKQIVVANKIVDNMLNYLSNSPQVQSKLLDIAYNQKKLHFYEKIFSVRNEQKNKVIRVFGLKIKLNRKIK